MPKLSVFRGAWLWSLVAVLSLPLDTHAAEGGQEQRSTQRPNIVYILLDDVGFSDLGSFGAEIETPNLDALAAQGIRYNSFYTRAICSPSRAALLTGRNSHSVGMGNLTNVITDAPGRRGQIDSSAVTIAEILREAGYNTFAVGKWHLVPVSKAGLDKRQWPLQRGFEQFYGFTGGMTDQFHPELVLDNTQVPPPDREEYHFTADIVDRSIEFIRTAKAQNPGRPFFLYFATGAAHAPHQAPREFVQKYARRYAQGWDQIRCQRFERQKRTGLIPVGTVLPPRNPDVMPWEQMSAQEKALAARFQAAYAGFIDHTDSEIGRLLSFLREADLFENTIIVVMSDNGASAEGGAHGTANLTYNVANIAGKTESLEHLLPTLEEIGSDRTYGNYPRGWAMVSNTPFSHYKQSVQPGGLRTPLILIWPRGIKRAGEVRDQFVDIMDITPTMLELAGVEAPTLYKGIPQKPLEGRSIAATFEDAAAPAPRERQYFELFGLRSIWSKDWMAIADHAKGAPFEQDRWALYDLRKDFSASTDVSGQHADVVEELRKSWQDEAAKYQVLPLDDASVRDPKFYHFDDSPMQYRYFPGTVQIPFSAGPRVENKSFTIRATVDRSSTDSEGVIFAAGDRFGGYVFYVRDNRLHFEFNDFGSMTQVVSGSELPLGPSTLAVAFDRTADFKGRVALKVDEREVASALLQTTPTVSLSWSSIDVGSDVGSPVSDVYVDRGVFAFAPGQLKDVVVTVGDSAHR